MNKEEKLISEEQKIQDAQELKEYVELAKNMMLRYVADKFHGKISIEYLKEFIENTNISIDYECDSKLGGYYQHLIEFSMNSENVEESSEIFINSEKLHVKDIKDFFQVIGIIIHEFQHEFSAEIAHKEFENKQIDEGFSDLFADECINHFLENDSDELIKFGWTTEEIEKIIELQKKQRIHTSAYERRITFYKNCIGIY